MMGITVWSGGPGTAAAQEAELGVTAEQRSASRPAPTASTDTNDAAESAGAVEAGTRTGNAPRDDAAGSRVPVDQRVLPVGTTQVATVPDVVAQLSVRSTPPPGWDRSLSPVVLRSTPLPPRSALDVERVTLPSEQEPIVGRAVTDAGWVFANPTGYSPPQPLRFGVVEQQGGWLEIQLPVRPNGTTGWVRAARVEVTSTSLGVEVSLSELRLRVVDSGTVLMDVPIAIGRPSRPTPTGSFTVTDIVPSTDPAGSYGPVALALDGYSEVLDTFPGENATESPDARAPVLALHGTNQPRSVGTAGSNGCPRLFNDDVVALARLVPAGTPVLIWP